MAFKMEKQELKKLLVDTISLLCRKSLSVQDTEAVHIEATIGITLNQDNVVVISFQETIQPDGSTFPLNMEEKENLVALQENEDELDNFESDANDYGNQGCNDEYENGNYANVSLSKYHSQLQRYKRRRLNNHMSKVYHEEGYMNERQLNVNQNGHQFRRQFKVKEEIMDDRDCQNVEAANVPDDNELADSNVEHDNIWNGGPPQLSFKDEFTENNFVDDSGSNDWNGGFTQVPPVSSKNFQERNFQVPTPGIKRSVKTISATGVTQKQGKRVEKTLDSLCKSLAYQGEQQFGRVICQVCGAALSCQSSLIKHIKGTHLSMDTCSCDICGQTFKWTMQLCRHKKRCHADVSSIVTFDSPSGGFDSVS